MTKDLLTQINDAIKDRQHWAQRQSLYYRARHKGLPRTNPPYPGAPNLHFPLIDTMIEQLKSYFVQQVYSGETLATFISLDPEPGETETVDYWFDYKLKYESNFATEIISAIDGMLAESGRKPVKVYWDDTKKEVGFDAINPLDIIVPKSTTEPNDNGDWIVHVMRYSKAQYKGKKAYRQPDGPDDNFLDTISGKGREQRTSNDTAYEQTKTSIEGITYGKPGEIVIWEVLYRDRDNKRITVETISPVLPEDDNVIREKFTLPFNRSAFKDGDTFPFFFIKSEIKDKGYYSERSTSELLLPFQESMRKTWNGKHEAMDFYNKPTFEQTQPGPIPTQNIRFIPGGTLPQGLKPVTMPSPPISFDQSLEFDRATAEYRVRIPDLGADQHLVPGSRGGGSKVTATQINAIVGQSSQTNDLRGRVFELCIGDGYKMAWSILLQYDSESLSYVQNKELQQLDPQLLQKDYLLVPNGSADSWNKGAETSKAMTVFQTLQGAPNIDQDELTKYVLEKVDVRLVKRLFRQTAVQQQTQMEEQDIETGALLLNGFGAQVNPQDDDKAHLQSLLQFGQGRMQEQNPTTPLQSHLISGHMQSHLQQLMQKKDPMLKQVAAQCQPMLQLLAHLSSQGQQQPPNVVPGPGSQPQLSPPTGASAQSDDSQGDAAKLMQGLAALAKAGAPVTPDQLNAVYIDAGLPPLNMASQPIQPPVPQPAAAGP